MACSLPETTGGKQRVVSLSRRDVTVRDEADRIGQLLRRPDVARDIKDD